MSANTRVFVANVDRDATDRELADFLELRAGRVADCRIARDSAGLSRCYAFVVFVEPWEADAAIELSGILLAGRALTIRPYQARPPQNSRVITGA